MNPPPLPPVIKEQSKEKTSAISAAKFSLWAPVLTIPVNLLTTVVLNSAQASGTYLGSVVQSGVTALVIVAGFGLGWFALWKTRQCGREGIWGRAVAGVVINGVLLIGVAFVAVKIIQRLSH
jgi:protein-S-isoprenylcysteine O-methyltransferase Ste14